MGASRVRRGAACCAPALISLYNGTSATCRLRRYGRGRRGGAERTLQHRPVDHLACLAASEGVIRAEGAIRVAGDYTSVVRGLDVVVECTAWGHIAEVRATRGINRPTSEQQYLFDELAPGHVPV